MTQPISVIAKSRYENACEPGSHWRKLPAVPGSPNPRFHNWSLATAILPGNAVVALRGAGYSVCPVTGAAATRHAGDPPRRGHKVVAGRANYEAILLAACPPGARRDIYLLLTQPGADRISQPHPPGSVEHIIVTRGGRWSV